MANILITDGEQRSALAAARSLGRAGHTVYVGAQQRSSLAGTSRYVRDVGVMPDPLRAPMEFVNEVVRRVAEWDVDLVLPVTEAALLAVLPERDRIRAHLPFPSAEAFARLCDKEVVANEAGPLGIRVPQTIVLRQASDLPRVGDSAVRFPLVVKPHRSVAGINGTRARGAVFTVTDQASLDIAIAGLQPAAFPVLLQQRVVGPGVGIFVLMHNGELVAAFAHRRIREKPPWGGVSVYRESIPLDRELLGRSVELLRSFGLEGAAMVEYKMDATTNIPYIMEINGRFWGSLQLAIDAGIDFPALLVERSLKAGGDTKPADTYRLGVRSRWFWGDVDSLLLRLRSPERSGTSRVRACLDFLRAFGPESRNEVLRWTDPAPAVRETIEWFKALSRHRSAHS